jgi:hypothetical protein
MPDVSVEISSSTKAVTSTEFVGRDTCIEMPV